MDLVVDESPLINFRFETVGTCFRSVCRLNFFCFPFQFLLWTFNDASVLYRSEHSLHIKGYSA